MFLSLDWDHSTSQVIIMYPQKYREEANGWAHHVKYMEYKNGLPALHSLNHVGIATAQEMDWNKKEEWPIPRSETELQKLATMEFDWFNCPDLAQSEAVD